MAAFTRLVSRIVPLKIRDIDTDQIIPARFLKTIDKEGLAKALFADWRFGPGGAPIASFALNAPDAAGAQILLAGDNFGCGSSREHAVWAIAAGGFRAVISSSFADIFRTNALKNGLLPVAVDPAVLEKLFALRAAHPALELTIDLAAQALLLPDGTRATFPIDGFSRHCLLNGIDELGYLLSLEAKISSYESRPL
jgi:3-isopropylmalate/(R)-2-methylmalate dehydratase small subunit